LLYADDTISPLSGFSKPHIIERRVDLPQPEGPTIDTKEPGAISRQISVSAGISALGVL